MFQYFSSTNNPTSESSPLTITTTTAPTTDEGGTVTTPTIVVGGTATTPHTTTPETETMMIVGHKLSYAHEDTLNEGNVTTAIESDEDNNHENDTADIKNDDDDGSLLSVDLDDLSGSILDNLPSSHDNNDVDHSIDNHSDDHNMMAVDNTAAPAFFFEPIVQAMQELQHTTATNSNTVIVALDDDDDDADDEIVLLAPSPSMNPSEVPQRTMKQAFAGKIACLICLMSQ